jgi:hypothetical protein
VDALNELKMKLALELFSVGERLPDDGQVCLVWSLAGYFMNAWHFSDNWFYAGTNETLYAITHWAALPASLPQPNEQVDEIGTLKKLLADVRGLVVYSKDVSNLLGRINEVWTIEQQLAEIDAAIGTATPNEHGKVK